MNKSIFCVITPDTYKSRDKILEILENNKFYIIHQETILLKNDDIEVLYGHLKEDRLWKELLAASKKGEVLIFAIKKKKKFFQKILCALSIYIPILRFVDEVLLSRAISELHALVGDLDSDETTIRGKFALNKVKNAIYVSTCKESAAIEINHFFLNENESEN